MSEPYTAIQVVMMPKDTNPHGTIFGGVLLAHIDMAGAIGAKHEVQLRGGNPKASFLTNDTNGPDPQGWLEGATATEGSWWPDFAGWLAERGGGRKRAPRSLGRPAAGFAPLDAAPGTYVFDA